MFSATVQQFNPVIVNYDVSTDGFIKIAIKYKQNDFSSFVNGVKTLQQNTGTTPSGLDRVTFDRGDGASNARPKANVRALHYFPEALTDTELQQLTTI